MKKIGYIVLLFALLSIQGFAQGHFIASPYDLKWERVYELGENEFSPNLLPIQIEGLERTASIYSGKIETFSDWKSLGYKELSLPMYIPRTRISASVLIEVRDGRYRVTLTNIVLIQNYDDPISQAGDQTLLKTFALNNKGEFKSAFLKTPVDIYEKTFDRLFTMQIENNEW